MSREYFFMISLRERGFAVLRVEMSACIWDGVIVAVVIFLEIKEIYDIIFLILCKSKEISSTFSRYGVSLLLLFLEW